MKYVDVDGPATQITRLTESPSDITWSPDGRTLAFRMRVPGRSGWSVESRLSQYRPKGAKWTEAPRVVEKLTYRRDRIGFTADGFMHIFVVPADGGTPRQVTSGDFDHGAPEFTPDGRTIVFTSGPRTEDSEYAWRESDIYAVDVATGEIRQLTTRSGPDGNPAVSPNGRLIAYTGYDMTTDTWVDSRLYVMNIDGSSPRVLTESLDRSPRSLRWAHDNSGIYFTVQDRGAQNLYFVSTRGDVREVTEGAHMLDVTDLGRNGTAVGTLTAPDRPADIVAFDIRRPADMRRLTDVNGDILAGKRLGAVEEIWYQSPDGLDIQGWIVKPPDFVEGRRYPLMLSIHGGPHSMYNVGFNFGRGGADQRSARGLDHVPNRDGPERGPEGVHAADAAGRAGWRAAAPASWKPRPRRLRRRREVRRLEHHAAARAVPEPVRHARVLLAVSLLRDAEASLSAPRSRADSARWTSSSKRSRSAHSTPLL